MAAGAFTLGASIELSADAPLREPYAAWMQGGLNFHSGKLGAMLAAQSMLEQGILFAQPAGDFFILTFLAESRIIKNTVTNNRISMRVWWNW